MTLNFNKTQYEQVGFFFHIALRSINSHFPYSYSFASRLSAYYCRMTASVKHLLTTCFFKMYRYSAFLKQLLQLPAIKWIAFGMSRFLSFRRDIKLKKTQ